MQYLQTMSLLGRQQQIIMSIPPVKYNFRCIFCWGRAACTMLEIKCLICWNTVRITTPRIRLNQLSLPNHYMLNRIGECTQVRCLLTSISTPENKGNLTAPLGLCKLQLMCRRDGTPWGPAIHHLPLHYCAVSPARLLEDFGMDVWTLVACY